MLSSRIKNIVILIGVLSYSIFAQDFSFPITVTDGSVSHTLSIGINEDATEAYDPGIDVLAPPAPPSGSFDTRLTWQDEEYFTDIRDTSINLKIFPLSYQPSSGGEIVLHWNSEDITPLGIFTIVDDTANTQFTLDMSTVDSLVTTDSPYLSSGLMIIVNPGGLVNIENENILQVTGFSLEQNYPNPFNPATLISYQLPLNSEVELSIYNTLGQKVTTLVSKPQPAGYYTIEWNAVSFASGVYYYRIKAEDFVDMKKMILIK